jgi:RimJ/RimL family protein N-acetyltransferase
MAGAAARRGSAQCAAMMSFAIAALEHRKDAVRVWRAANDARGNSPSAVRVARVREKLDDDEACVVIGIECGEVVAMALAEPGREARGQGAIAPGLGHVSMVFVDPDRWGRGIGTSLLDALHHAMLEGGWRTSSLWTRVSNGRARRLYERCRYRKTAEVAQLPGGDEIIRYELALDQAAPPRPGGAESLETEHLILRPWRDEHAELLSRLARIPEVMTYIGPGELWSTDKSEEISRAATAHWAEHSFGWRAAEERETGHMVGFLGLNLAGEGTVGVAVDEYEIGWWMDPVIWGRGYAREGGAAVRDEALPRL